jgi:hypothetical protein
MACFLSQSWGSPIQQPPSWPGSAFQTAPPTRYGESGGEGQFWGYTAQAVSKGPPLALGWDVLPTTGSLTLPGDRCPSGSSHSG